jgi:Na+/proline symporter
VDLFAGALFIKVSLGWNIYLSIIILILIAAIFSAIGGLTAVMWTDFIQGKKKWTRFIFNLFMTFLIELSFYYGNWFNNCN